MVIKWGEPVYTWFLKLHIVHKNIDDECRALWETKLGQDCTLHLVAGV